MITSSKTILLRSIDYQESSKIITVLCEKNGKVALMARGVKKPKNKLAGCIEVGNIIDVTYYYKPSRNIQTIKEASIGYQSLNFRKDFERASILYATLELIAQLTHENEENLEVFSFAESFIKWLGDSEFVHPSIFAYVQLRLSQIIGFGLIDDTTQENETVYLNISSGSIAHQPDSELSYKLTNLQSKFVTLVLNARNSEVFKLGLQNLELKKLINHLDVYFKYHLDGYKERRSDTIFEQMMKVT
ncbi:DNA repair protein RecO [Balneola vulgaris]|uniref:DNA repair protein RecO n=1 Tax=Balneola vulgaris TaxID=287535 RepID=UPI00036BB2F7|nr:DNA repair protein RecO [Balneola vulgaris]